MDYRRANRKSELIMALVLLGAGGLFGSTAASAEDSLFSDINLFRNHILEDVRDGDVQMAGNGRSGLHLSSSSQTNAARYVSSHGADSVSNSGVHVSWKLAW